MSKHASKPASSHPKPKGKSGGGQTPARQASKSKPASKTTPTLPKHEFPQPYSRLLLIGEHELEEVQHIYEEIAAMLKVSAPREAVARLTAMALDESYYDYEDVDHPDPKETRTWTRLHAIGVLCFMGEAASASVEPLLPLLDDEDDWLREEMPLFYASIGEPAIEPLRHLLHDPDEATFMRTGAGDSLEQIAETHTALRPAILPLLEQALVESGTDTLLAAFLVCNLLDLNAKESLALIQQAFEEQRVDESVVEIRDVEEHFGLISTNPISPKTASPKLRYTSSSSGEFALPGKWEDWEEGGEEEDWESEELTIRNVSEQPDAANENTTDAVVASVPFVKPVKLGRNEPCWCGSGKKYKQCHG